MRQPTVFISYSHDDEPEKDALLSHLGVLQSAGLIDLWSDDKIDAGANWTEAMAQAVTQARVAVLLITANFLTSHFNTRQELPRLLERHRQEGLTIIPIMARAYPTFRWQAVAVAEIYQLSIKMPSGDSWQTETSDTHLAYPPDAPSLAPGSANIVQLAYPG